MPIKNDLSRRERKKKATRENILNVALDIISKQGIYVTTIEDVTEEADIGKGTFYQYFPSKEELLEQLLSEGLEKLITLCRASLYESKSATASIKALTKIHVNFLTSHSSYLLLFHQVRGYLQLQHPVSANLRKIYSQYLIKLAELLSPFYGDSPQSAQKAKEAALSLSAYSTGLTTHYRLFHRLLDLTMHKDAIEKKILVALLQKRTK